MSKVVSPYPPYHGPAHATAKSRWWRMPLPVNEKGQRAIAVYEPDKGWMSVEFFDGFNVIIDTGFDQPTSVIFDVDHRHLDVLSEDRPTPCWRWNPLTGVGVTTHPSELGLE